MSTKPSSPELRPNRYDALVVLVVLALAAGLAVRPFLAARAPPSGALTDRSSTGSRSRSSARIPMQITAIR